MDDLIKRLQEAETGSRGLDAEIWYALIEKWGGHPDRDMIGRWPAYTTSLDAIVDLIGAKLPGSFVGCQENRGFTHRFSAWIDPAIHDPDASVERHGHTLPLAWCTALLTALRQQEKG